MDEKSVALKVFFNASVILAGLRSPTGGSAKILGWSRKGKICGIVSEVVLDEVFRKYKKVGIKKPAISNLKVIFCKLLPSLKTSLIERFEKIALDFGDTHVLASSLEAKADYLVSLDKKHILSLKRIIKKPKIVSPGELIQELSK